MSFWPNSLPSSLLKLPSLYTLYPVCGLSVLFVFIILLEHNHQILGLKLPSKVISGRGTGWPLIPQESRAMCPGRVCRWMWPAAGLGGPLLCPQTVAVLPPLLILCLKLLLCPAANCAPSAKPLIWWELRTTRPVSTPAHSVAPWCATSVALTPTLT